MKKLIFAAFLVAASFSLAKSDYLAAVYEHSPFNKSTPQDTIEDNLVAFIKQIETAKTRNVDLIVFPEYGLTGLVLDPTNYSFELPEVHSTNFTDPLLVRLRNSILQNQIYVVVNLLERSTDDRGKTIYYNTNLAFDRSGTVIAKYRKINLFNEPNLTQGSNATATFVTDFGVTFGLITCFDILYNNPSKTILEGGSVNDIIFPTAWHSQLPLYMSLSVQAGYAAANKITLLAANLNDPDQGIGGSGIFQREKRLNHILTGTRQSQLVYANVARMGRSLTSTYGSDFLDPDAKPDIVNYNAARVFEATKYKYRSTDFSKNVVSETVCDGKFCCNFNIAVTINGQNNAENYKLVVYDGTAPWGTSRTKVRFCGLIYCRDDSSDSCGYRPDSNLTTTFEQINVGISSEPGHSSFYRPVTLLGNLLPFSNFTFLEGFGNSTSRPTLNTTAVTSNVIFAGIYARSGVAAYGVSFVAVLVAMVASVLSKF